MFGVRAVVPNSVLDLAIFPSHISCTSGDKEGNACARKLSPHGDTLVAYKYSQSNHATVHTKPNPTGTWTGTRFSSAASNRCFIVGLMDRNGSQLQPPLPTTTITITT